jgi:hypothetical protein
LKSFAQGSSSKHLSRLRGIYYLEEIVTNEETPAVPKKNWSRRKKIALTIYSSVVVFLIFFSVLLYLLIPNDFTPPPGPYLQTTKSSTATDTIWTVVYVSGGSSILKSDVYVQVKDASGLLMIATERLGSASGTHGFSYDSTTGASGLKISVGDVFSLNKTMYSLGSTIILFPSDATHAYCVLPV